jgi:hypothetical protein
VYVFRVWVDCLGEGLKISKIPERLHAARCSTGAQGDQQLAILTNLFDPFDLICGADRPFYQTDIIRPRQDSPASFQKVGDFDFVYQLQQLIFQV